MTTEASPLARTLPIMEVFGPTVQGEGPLAGSPTFFIRFGLCEFRCSWCDSMFAVLPQSVSEHAEKLSAFETVGRLESLRPAQTRNPWVTLSGGNPAMHQLGPLVESLHTLGWRVAIETQGASWNSWLDDVESLVVSPKPPSSGMVSEKHDRLMDAFIAHASEHAGLAVKIVVFDDADYDWAKENFAKWAAAGVDAEGRFYLSVGTPQPADEFAHLSIATDEARRVICEQMRWLFEKVANDPEMTDVRVLSQLHVLAWGHARGV
jgi:7-carboxy-7-deazaguanine synthase